jgi:hypothetical protein
MGDVFVTWKELQMEGYKTLNGNETVYTVTFNKKDYEDLNKCFLMQLFLLVCNLGTNRRIRCKR